MLPTWALCLKRAEGVFSHTDPQSRKPPAQTHLLPHLKVWHGRWGVSSGRCVGWGSGRSALEHTNTSRRKMGSGTWNGPGPDRGKRLQKIRSISRSLKTNMFLRKKTYCSFVGLVVRYNILEPLYSMPAQWTAYSCVTGLKLAKTRQDHTKQNLTTVYNIPVFAYCQHWVYSSFIPTFQFTKRANKAALQDHIKDFILDMEGRSRSIRPFLVFCGEHRVSQWQDYRAISAKENNTATATATATLLGYCWDYCWQWESIQQYSGVIFCDLPVFAQRPTQSESKSNHFTQPDLFLNPLRHND